MSDDSSGVADSVGAQSLRFLVTLTAAVVAYAMFAGLIWGFDTLAERSHSSYLRSGGLVVAMILLSLAIVYLNRRGSSLAGTLGPIMALLAVILFFAVADWIKNGDRGSFLTMGNFRTIAVQTSTIAVAALGMTMIIIAGGIDLSAGTTLALSATVMAYCLDDQGGNTGIGVAVIACILTGCIAGLINGSLVSLLGVVPFIVSLGTMTVLLGIGKIIAKETTVRPKLSLVPSWITQMVTPLPKFKWLPHPDYPFVPNFGWGVWLALGLAALMAFVLHFTVFGRHVFALGSSEPTARLCGVNVRLVKVAVYALAGVFVGIAGMYQFARLSSGSPTSGVGLELKVIAAVVIGGGSLNGGRGSVVGTLTGAMIMLVIASGCTALELKNPYQDIIIGTIIVVAVTLDQFRQRRLAG